MASVARITVGVPVYNGAATLAEALECIRIQTFEDIEVIISDNCSTDDSAEIAQRYVEKDDRFRLISQTENIGAKSNFRSLIDASSCDLFMWRSDDDLSTIDFIERLHRVIEQNSAIDLVGHNAVFFNRHGERLSAYSYSPQRVMLTPVRLGRQILNASPTWIYGLWRRNVLRDSMDRMNEEFPYLWGWDPLTLLPTLLVDRIAVDPDAVLYKREFPAQRYTSRVPARRMVEMRRAFRRSCFREFRRERRGILEKCVLGLYVLRFANRRVYRFWKTVRAQMREALGITRK
jgi:glycosyltransferase involved in cell wall biosynthesis